jgi:hypothetical protein
VKQQDFTTSVLVDQSPKEAFNAINKVHRWWAGDIVGSATTLGDEFTYRYKAFHYSKQRVVELVPYKRIVWLVVESSLQFIADKSEWNGTKVVFEIAERGANTEIRFTHVGLVPGIECYGACSSAWNSIVSGSLPSLIAAGKAELKELP